MYFGKSYIQVIFPLKMSLRKLETLSRGEWKDERFLSFTLLLFDISPVQPPLEEKFKKTGKQIFHVTLPQPQIALLL